MTKRVEALLREIMENGLVFDARTDTNDNGGGKIRENTVAQFGNGSSPIPPSARASVQRATAPASAICAPTTSAILSYRDS